MFHKYTFYIYNNKTGRKVSEGVEFSDWIAPRGRAGRVAGRLQLKKWPGREAKMRGKADAARRFWPGTLGVATGNSYLCD